MAIVEPAHSRSPSTTSISLDLMGQTVRLAQDPNSKHLGTTVWDASIVLAKLLEKNMRKGGDFSQVRVAGKRAIELGAGMGLGGMALALMGAQVTLTDTAEVLPMLRRNCEGNLGSGKVSVVELDWFQPDQVAALQPPFDIVVAADCIYSEAIIPHLHRTIMDLTTERSTVVVVNELRSHTIQQAFIDTFNTTHVLKQVPQARLHEDYRHPLIQVFVCKKKRRAPQPAQDAMVEAATDLLHRPPHKDVGEVGMPLSTTPGPSSLQGSGADEAVSVGGDTAEGSRLQSIDRSQPVSCLGDVQGRAGMHETADAHGHHREACFLTHTQWQTRRLGTAMAQMLGSVVVPGTAAVDGPSQAATPG
ncbi:putative methyltransferase-domain-containing protein [Haematococcus lacustris]